LRPTHPLNSFSRQRRDQDESVHGESVSFDTESQDEVQDESVQSQLSQMTVDPSLVTDLPIADILRGRAEKNEKTSHAFFVDIQICFIYNWKERFSIFGASKKV
jgi:hypothetical protein